MNFSPRNDPSTNAVTLVLKSTKPFAKTGGSLIFLFARNSARKAATMAPASAAGEQRRQKADAGSRHVRDVLNAQGHIVVDLRLHCAEDGFLVDTDADLREKAIQSFRRYIIPTRWKSSRWISTPWRSKDRARGTAGEDAAHRLAGNAGVRPLRRLTRASHPRGLRHKHGRGGYEVWVNGSGMEAIWGAACGQAPTYDMFPCGSEALESLRIEAGIPRLDKIGEDVIPLEAGLLNAVSFNKGCYIGQEIVERARSRGHVNWKLTGLIVSAGDASAGEKAVVEEEKWRKSPVPAYRPHLANRSPSGMYGAITEPGAKLAFASGTSAEVARFAVSPPRRNNVAADLFSFRSAVFPSVYGNAADLQDRSRYVDLVTCYLAYLSCSVIITNEPAMINTESTASVFQGSRSDA